jgi:hypothetical protein
VLVDPVVAVVLGFGEEGRGGVFAESGRDGEAAGAGADDDHVVDEGQFSGHFGKRGTRPCRRSRRTGVSRCARAQDGRFDLPLPGAPAAVDVVHQGTPVIDGQSIKVPRVRRPPLPTS